MIYRKLKRTWSHGYANHIPKFMEVFPELKRLSSEDLCDRFRELKMDFYTDEKTTIKPWIKFTLPFALLAMSLMFICLPINFLITGNWGYSIKDTWILNWFKSLRLINI